MRKAKLLISILLIFAFVLSLSSCYMISAQPMRLVKGTYKLSSYSYTPQHERREGYTPRTYDYVNGEEYLYEDYLVVTGSGTGYYAHKDAGGDSYVKEITLRYEYESEGSDVAYVVYNDSISQNESTGKYRLGVTKNSLNYSKSAFDYTELITKRPMRTEDIYVRWDKVSKKTDLSYVEEKLPDAKKYEYSAFSYRGIYMLYGVTDTETGEALDIPYEYYFIVVDTARDGAYATLCYLATADGATETRENVTFQFSDSVGFTVGNMSFVSDSYGSYLYDAPNGQTWHISIHSRNLCELEDLIGAMPE